MKAIVADDSLLVTEHVKEILDELPGLEIAGCARDANECLQLVRRLDPAVIILDLEMPGGGGLHVLRTIKMERPDVIVIVLTNAASAPIREACFNAGAEFFLDKSYEFGQLRRIVSQIVQNAGMGHIDSGSDSSSISRKTAQ